MSDDLPEALFDLIGDLLLEQLLEQGKLTHDQITHAAQTAQERGVSVGDVLMQMHLIDQSDVLQAQAALADIPWVDSIDIDQIDVELSNALPVSFARNHGVLPLWEDNDTIKIAISKPNDFDGFDALRIFFDKPIEALATNDTILIDAINKVFDRRAAADQVMSDIADEQVISGEEGFDQIDIDIIDADDEAPIIRLVNAILNQAVKARASDIHIEPFDRHIAVRFRIDGVLSEILEPPKKFHASISSRIKVMAGLDIAEKRIPQDGRIKIKVAGKDIDIRLSTVPTNYGERLVMRLLDKTNVLQDLSNIGMGENVLQDVNDLLGKSYGIVLVTGPTGSGKTSTLYACLAKINSPVRNIITVENPVEYQLNGIGQIQTNEKVGLTFASGLRSILRQDPDVVMVGEIRDSETANIAIQASLTGHLVFSTVHTNDAASAVSRLVDMGVEPFLVSSSLVGMMAQRLVRRLCESCKQPVVPTETELDQLGLDRTRFNQLSEGHCYRPVGCAECMDKGYIGRIAIFELLVVDDDIRKLIMENVASSTIKKKAIQRGMVTLREDGRSKILAGITSIDEVLRVTQDDLLELEE